MKPTFKLSAEQRRALQEELRSKGFAAPNEAIPVRSDPARRLLSFGQQRLWFLEQLAPGSAYNMPSAVRFRGPLDAGLLARACAEIIRRHEALRSHFPARQGEPYQALVPVASLLLPRVDLSGLPAERRLGAVAEWSRREAVRPFDLQAGPLLRAVLFRLDGEDHVALFVLHHIIGDGRSSEILVRELGMLYAAFSSGLPSPLPELPIQFADFAVWQQERLTGERLENLLAWWRERLAGAPEELGLPLDRPRQEGRRRRGASLAQEIPPDLHPAAAALGQRFEATPFMAYLAALTALLHVYTGRQDLLVGTPVLGRDRAETADLIGFFVNTLALRSELAGDLTFQAHLAHSRATVLGALQHQELPFERLVEELRPERHAGRSPLVEVLFSLEGAKALHIPGLSAEPFEIAGGEAKLDMVLAVRAAGERTWLAAEYDADLFDASTIQRLLRHFEALLAAVIAQPERPLSRLELLAPAERQQALAEWNDVPVPGAGGGLLHELVEAQAARTPDACAVLAGESAVTYAELAARAGSLARQLRRMGVGPDLPVALCCGRTPAMVVGLLGILEAGGAYVPLDPAYPRERLSFMLRDALGATGTRVLVTESRLAGLFTGEDGPAAPHRVVLLDGPPMEPEKGSDRAGPSPTSATSDNLAYIIYTSGSTGVPKGVALRHGSAVALVSWALATYPQDRLAGVLAATSICFDLSVFELFVPLACGGTVILAEDALALARLPAAAAVTLINSVPSALAELERAGAVPASVRTVNLAGEPLRRDLAARLYTLPGIEVVYNLYGPSEDTTYSTGSRVDRESSREPSIGRPLPGGRAHVLDAAGRPLPIGVPGELWLGGAGLARGYHRRPNLTADRFRPDPFDGAGGRLYRTGDLVRRLPDGEIDFLGRLDHQVKVRGFRVELGEIEVALSRHPRVREAAVLALGEEGERRLAAWVVPVDGEPAVEELRSFLRQSLPAPLVPTVWRLLPTLPQTPSGKIDRAALARSVADLAAEATPSRTSRTSQTPIEEIVAGIWAEVLRRGEVGADDDFFSLGGHSLLAARVVSRIRLSLGAELPLRVLFEAPTVARLAAAVERALRQPGEPRSDEIPLERVARSGDLPLSFHQQRLWFLDQLHPGSSAYNIALAVRLTGRLDAAVLSRVFAEIARRHETLRTVFAAQAGEPRQVISAPSGVLLPVIDLAALPNGRAQGEVLRLAGEESHRPFDLAAGPLLRLTLLRLGSAEHVLLGAMHHIVSDAWSVEILIREVAELYAAFASGRPSPLQELPVQYADFAVWQHRRLTGEALEAELAHWRERLAGAPPDLELPTDRPRPPVWSDRGASRAWHPPEALAARLHQAARALGATRFMVLLAAFQALLSRVSGSLDISVGIPVAGRGRPELEELIGFFVNTLVLRTDLSGEPGFAGLVERVRESSLQAFAHQDLPFERLVEELAPGRRPGQTPFFRAAFAFRAGGAGLPAIPGLTMEPLPAAGQEAKFDLTLALVEKDAGLAGALSYSTDLFDGATIERLLGHFERLLSSALEDPERRLSDLPLLAEAERQQVLREWNRPGPPQSGASVPERVARWAHETPEAIAGVDAAGRILTYGELAAGAGAVARRLRRLGVSTDALVAVCLERSLETLTALTGVLWAGGAYLPLDPGHPAERLAWQLQDSAAAVLVTRRELLDRCGAGGLPTVLLEEELPEETAGQERGELLAARPDPASLAYVIYTSGSTGRPKGVGVAHAGLTHLMAWWRRRFALTPADRSTLLVAPSFDASILEIWPFLTAGASVRIPPEATRSAPRPLLRWLAENGITVSFLPTPLTDAILAEASLDAAALQGLSLRVVTTGGDRLQRRPAPGLGFELVNLYGPTEITVMATAGRVDSASGPAAGSVAPSIGRPIEGAAVHLVNGDLSPVPAGVLGEMLLGGPGIARGYLGRADLTAERFVPDPFSGEAGARLYRTGDLARWLPAGEIEFVGRRDQQVKVRGVRIELGEIEAVLARHPEVKEAVVLVVGDQGEPRLVASVVAVGPAPTAEALRAFLRRSLPEPMVPASWLFLDSLPLTSHGKLDRRALAQSIAEAPASSRPRLAPRTPVEEILAGLWADVLRRGEVGVDDDFFALGGHSLLATQLVARIEWAFDVELPVREVFEEPTVAGLAPRLEAALQRDRAESVPLVPVRRQGAALPLSFAQERLWFLDRLEPGSATYNMPGAVDLRGALRVAAVSAALGAVVRRHESLRTTFAAAAGIPSQRVSLPAVVGLPLIDLGGLAALSEEAAFAEAARLRERFAAQGFDLERGPLFAAALLRLAAERHHLLFVLHHIVSDGWSIGVLIREFAALYQAADESRPSPLPELPVQYGDFAVWQRSLLAGRGAAELAYWGERLGGVSPLELPTDRPRPAVQSYRGGRRVRLLAPELSEALRAFGRREGVTPFMILLAGAQALLARQSGQEDVAVGTPVAGRRRIETEGLIGCFLNTLVLRTDLSGGPGLRELAARVRETALGAYAHQEVPFEALLTHLGVERDLSRTPLFQVFFNMLNLPREEQSLPGLAVEPLAASSVLASKFDMTFYVDAEGQGIRLDLVYNTDLFDEGRMEELLAQLELLLEQAVERPEEPLSGLSLVTARAAALLPDPSSALDATWAGAVHELFAAQARRAPERPAVEDREGVWSYGELAEAVDRLSAWLGARGVRRGDCVAIYAHRSAPLVQAVMGTLAAGAAFTILDPAYPAARLVEILELAAPTAVLQVAAAGPLPAPIEAWLAASGRPHRELPGGGAASALAALITLSDLADFARRRPKVVVGPDDVACLGFTSGSTGRPKGILGRHGPLSHFLPWQCARFGLRAEDRFSLLSGLAHDPLQRDIFTPLYLGASIAVPDPAEIAAAGRLAQWMAREQVTAAHLTPAMGQLLTEPPAGGAAIEVPSLRLVLLVGDALTRLDVARIRGLAPGVTCVNLFGSTETQRAVGFHVVEPEEVGARDKQVLPLGSGMQDVQLLVLNRAGRLAGIGEVGEIAVRSPHLALGYLGDPGLTAEKFRNNPFRPSDDSLGDRTGDRIYHTGDLGRYLPNGEVSFVGRVDLQVKIRGFRIEPAEIEASLASQPGVREAIVLPREQRGERRLVAYVVPQREGAVAAAGLRAALRERLPAYMVPADFVFLERLPLNPNGKVDRRALAAIAPAISSATAPGLARSGGEPPASELEEKITAAWQEVLGVEAVGANENFFDAGGHSLLLVRLHSRLEELLGRAIPLVELFSHPTIRSQAERFRREAPVAAEPAHRSVPGARAGSGRIAVIGMAGRFPEAADLERFWESLRDGVDGITRFSDEELAAAGVSAERVRRPRSVRSRGVLADVDLFDAAFFDFSPLQAQIMDPQLRLLLECAWEALESAGCDPQRYGGSIGVYAGTSLSSYFLSNLASRTDLLEAVGGYQTAISVDRDYLTTQVSYKLGLKGPSFNVQTACSTSLVAVHLACQALLAGECDVSLAGGVSIKIPQVSASPYEEGGIDSLSGSCRTFDAGADGTVWGSGVGLVVLKRLEDALADGDPVRAVILGSAINNDGALKVGYTAPSIEGQAAVIAAAQARAGISPDTVTYIEAHGTGTPLGDPIEVAALTRAFRSATERTGFCALGSVKTNVGHLGAAAGIAGLIKTVLALEHGQIPPSLGFAVPNPVIDFAASPFYVNTALREWRAAPAAAPRRAGISSFGMGGTNAHVVLEEAPPATADRTAAVEGSSRPWQLLPLSARSEPALEEAAARLAAWLERQPDADAAPPDLGDIAWTLQSGRRAFPWRRIVVSRSGEEARQALATPALTAFCSADRRPVAFLFPGQGSQHAGMGRGLYDGEPVFRREVDACAELLRPLLGRDLREVLYPAPERQAEAERELLRTRLAQPALFVTEYALARLWMSWGIAPSAMIGHSLGEYVAACLAGVLTLADALALVAARGELMDEMPGGAMLSVELGERELLPLLGPDLSLAAVNGPSLCVASGPEEAIAALEARLAAAGVPGAAGRRLYTSHAFHSAMMEPALARFAARVAAVELRPPAIPYLSNLTGEWMTAADATDPGYWVRHLRQTVRFGAGVESLLTGAPEGRAVLLEVGPGRALGSLARQARQTERPERPATVVASMRRPRAEGDDQAVLLEAVGRLWLAGVEIDWAALQAGERRRRLPLPTYPFERRRFWAEPGRIVPPAATQQPGQPMEMPPELLEALRKLAGGEAFSLAVTAEGAVTVTRAAAERSGSETERERSPSPEPRDLPHGATETRIAVLFGQLLGVEEVKATDDFFELGGHSLLGTRLVSRLRDELAVELPLEALFEAPTPAGLAARIEVLRAQESAATAVPEIVPRLRPSDSSDPSKLPLSFAQERLWFLDQLDPGSPAYNIPMALRLAGRLDVSALASALGELVRRHEILRTTLPAAGEGSRPVQRIAAPRSRPLPTVDLSGLPALAGDREASRLAGAEARHPFDLESGPLLRTVLLRLAEREHRLLLTLHHTITDGWSLHILGGELTALYAAFAAGERPALPELPVQYADYALWQRERLSGRLIDDQLAFWKARLGGELPVLDLPTDRPRPAVESFRGARERTLLPAGLAAALGALGPAHGATLFMTLLAAFDVVLWRTSRQRDLIVGSPIAGRIRPEIEPLIGLFLNTLALRVDLDGDPPFLALLARVRETTLAAYAHQELPFERLIGELHLRRDLGRSPLFQVMLILQNTQGTQGSPAERRATTDLVLEALPVETGATKLDLTLTFEEGPAGLYAAAEYSTDLFDATTVRRLLHHVEILLAGAAAHPAAPLSALPLLTAAERHQLLTGWNDSPAEDTAVPVHELVAAQAARSPEAVALLFQGGSLTYRDLAVQSDRLARRLAALGIGPEVKVALCLERSPALVVALLAVLKAGGAYVPLDPRHPRERLALILADAGAPILLTEERLRDDLPAFDGTVVLLGKGEEEQPAARPLPQGLPGNLAYAIYTSGSTGRPKGVEIEHRGLTSFLAYMAGRLRIGPGDLLAAVTTISFDIAALEIFLPLITGARLALLSAETAADGEALARTLVANGATLMQATPATWRMVIEAGLGPLPGFKALCGGEALTPDLARALTARAAEVWNVYGPTETTIWSAAWRVPAEPETVSVGRPIAGTRLYVLDDSLPVPAGAAGELAIGGVGLARGYLGRPDLTAERFVPDPFASEPGARMYRTGDLARHRPDGDLEILGRLDHQVKIRGFRIELGEIEAHLATHPAIREAAVLARERGAGQRFLAAYVVQGEEAERGKADAAELREFLRGRLPDYMVPAVYVDLAALPLNPSGKVDRRALSLLETERAGSFRETDVETAPGTETEERLAEIWREVLRVERVGIHDNFFELGGDSVLSIQVISRARCAGLALTARQIFERPTVAGLAALALAEVPQRLETTETPEKPPSAFPLAALDDAALARLAEAAGAEDGIADVYPASPMQQAMVAHTLQAPGSGVYIGQLSLKLGRGLDSAAFARAWNRIVERHALLRTAFIWLDSDRPLQVVLPRRRPDWEHGDWRGLSPAEQRARAAEYLAEDRRRGFDLQRPPLLRLALFDLGEEGYRFVWSFHHVLVDGWSLPILLRELFLLYEEETGRGAAGLSPPPLFRDYIVWLEGRDAGAAEQLWRRSLAGFDEPTPVGVDRSGPGARPGGHLVAAAALPAAETDALRSFARSHQLTLNTLVQGAWALLLSRSSGREDVVYGAVTSGRSAPLAGIESMVGIFINTLPARTIVRGEEELLPWLRRLQERQAEERQFEYLPLSQIQGWSAMAHGRELFQSILAFENYPIDEPMRERFGKSLGISEVDLAEQTNYPLNVTAIPRSRLDLRIHYEPGRFDGAMIERLLGHFRVLLAGMLSHPGGRLADLTFLTAAERHQLLAEWNDSAADLAAGDCIHRVIEAQAARTPSSIALVAGERSLTYAELNARGNQLARFLRALGAGPEMRVGICVERSIEMVIGLLGILKTGGAYVPLDPAYPAERLAFIVEDALGQEGVSLLLTQGSLARLFETAGTTVVRLDEDWGAIAGHRGGDLGSDLDDGPSPGNLAYVIYTSGSTGRPKGVQIDHASLANEVAWFRQSYALGPEDRMTQIAGPAFDAAVAEIWPALTAGASLHIPDEETRSSPAELVRWLDAERITFCHLPTPLAEMACAERWPRGTALRVLMTGGEALHRPARRDLPFRFYNHYGPTEATVDASWTEVLADEEGAPPIGRPIANAQIHLVDRNGDPVPIGVPGELWVAGAGVARGYLRRAELTAERFTPDPWGRPGARLYRTGDLARFRADGRIEFMGRIDGQVKVRGFRVELGEIEAVLTRNPAVRDAVVVLREDLAAGQGLVAYVVPREGAELPAGGLAAFLRERLPDYMVPSYYKALERLPLTVNGKVDRKALPAPERPLPAAYMAPVTAFEATIAEIWSEVLGVPRVGRDESFFDLGGHSILMIQMRKRLQETLQRSITMVDLFRHTTVSSLAAFLSRSDTSQPAFASPEHGRERRAGGERLKQRLGRRTG